MYDLQAALAIGEVLATAFASVEVRSTLVNVDENVATRTYAVTAKDHNKMPFDHRCKHEIMLCVRDARVLIDKDNYLTSDVDHYIHVRYRRVVFCQRCDKVMAVDPYKE